MADRTSLSDWERVASLFDEARHLPAGEQLSFVTAATPDAPAIRADVLAMLGVADPAAAFGIEAWLRTQSGEPADLPSHVGPWRIVRELGRGGMGVVYLAERAGVPFRQYVALKVLRAGLAGDEVRARFERERRILARLTHPAVVPLIDGGVAEDGRPYLVMQYVDGDTITRHADAKRLAIAARLRQFIVVCRAVQHAHAHLVVHRDLKPSNILVDQDGTVRLLDFGIAKMLGPDDGEADEGITREVVAPLTPARAAPEQLRGEPPTIATDVWALGVLLHELVTGRLPHAGGATTLAARADEITGRELTRLSRLVLQPPDDADAPSLGALAEARATTPDRLSRFVRGDLETIVAKALHPRAERRYESVGALADDIGAFLDGRPIAARPDAIGYRFRRFVARHRAASAAVALAVVAVAALTVGTLVQNARVTRERDRAEAEGAKARAVADLLVDLLRGSGPTEVGRADQVSVAELLDRGARQVGTLSGQPDVQARLWHTLAVIQSNRSQVAKAREWFERAVTAGAHLDDADPDRATLLIDYAAAMAGQLDQRGEARDLMRRLIARLEGQRPASPLLHARALHTLALATRGAEGMVLAERALGVLRADEAPDPVAVSDALNAVGELAYLDLNDNARARAAWTESLRLVEAAKGPDHPATLTVLGNLGIVLEDPGQALEAHRRVFDARLKMYGPDSEAVAAAANNWAYSLVAGRRYAEAEPLFAQAAAVFARSLGAAHRETCNAMRNLGIVQTMQGKHVEGLDTFDRLDASMVAGKTPPWERAGFGTYRAQILRRLGRLDEAERSLRAGLEQLRREPTPQPYRIAEAIVELGRVAFERRQFERARAWFAEAVALRERETAAATEAVAEARAELGRALLALGRDSDGQGLLEANVPVFAGWLIAHPGDLAALRAALGQAAGKVSRNPLGRPARP